MWFAHVANFTEHWSTEVHVHFQHRTIAQVTQPSMPQTLFFGLSHTDHISWLGFTFHKDYTFWTVKLIEVWIFSCSDCSCYKLYIHEPLLNCLTTIFQKIPLWCCSQNLFHNKCTHTHLGTDPQLPDVLRTSLRYSSLQNVQVIDTFSNAYFCYYLLSFSCSQRTLKLS